MSIGKPMKYWMIERGLTRYKLQMISGVHNSMITNYLKDLCDPPVRTIRKLCEALEITPNDLLDWSEKFSEGSPAVLTLNSKKIKHASKRKKVKNEKDN